MLISYGFTYAPIEARDDLYEMAQYALSFFSSHVVVIFIVANTVFYLKDIDPRFKTEEDETYDDLPTLKAYKERQEAQKRSGEKPKHFLLENLQHEFVELKQNVQNFTENPHLPEVIAGPLSHIPVVRDHLPGHNPRTRRRSGSSMPTSHHGTIHQPEQDVMYSEKSSVSNHMPFNASDSGPVDCANDETKAMYDEVENPVLKAQTLESKV